MEAGIDFEIEEKREAPKASTYKGTLVISASTLVSTSEPLVYLQGPLIYLL